MYNLSYLPLADSDLDALVDHLLLRLHTPQAVARLLDDLEAAIQRLAEFPHSCRVYQPLRDLEKEYRLLPVHNYAVLYTVCEQTKTVQIHRVVYAAMDMDKLFATAGGKPIA